MFDYFTHCQAPVHPTLADRAVKPAVKFRWIWIASGPIVTTKATGRQTNTPHPIWIVVVGRGVAQAHPHNNQGASTSSHAVTSRRVCGVQWFVSGIAS